MDGNEQTRMDLYDIVEELTTTGKKELDTTLMKRLKLLCKSSDVNLKHAYHLLTTQLEKEHSEIRYSVVQIFDQLFARSSLFRELLVNDFHHFLELSVEVELSQPLPPPKARANDMRLMSLKAIKDWNDKFGGYYKKLRLGYEYLTRVKKVDFGNLRAQQLAEDRARQEFDRRKEQLLLSRLHNVKTDYAEFSTEISNCIQQAKSCFALLLPKPEHFQEIEDAMDDDNLPDAPKKPEEDGGIEIREGGLSSLSGINPTSYSLTVTIPASSIKLTENNDNCDILTSLREAHHELHGRYLPMVKSWVRTLSKLPNEREMLVSILNMKSDLKEIAMKFSELEISKEQYQTDSDDEDFVDVPEDQEIELPAELPQGENISTTQEVSLPGSSTETTEEYSSRKSQLLARAPFVQFDSDLRYWGHKKLHITPVVKLDSLHRFWNSSEHDDEFIPKELEASLTMRAMTFSGKFEKVKWECRAPLGNGQLCKRQDREKCPFHGVIVARNAMGYPVDEIEAENDKRRLATLAEKESQEIQNEIAMQTGISNIVKEKAKKVNISKLRYARLTDVKRLKKTPRKRLERKILTKTALERVGAKNDQVVNRRSLESFGSNWNYQITQ